MQLMGLKEEYARSRDWVQSKPSFDRDDRFSTFEVGTYLLHLAFQLILMLSSRNQTTIRVLGGLLSAYHLSNHDPLYLKKAVEEADKILPVFDTLRAPLARHSSIDNGAESQERLPGSGQRCRGWDFAVRAQVFEPFEGE